MIRAEVKIFVTASRRDEILQTLKWLMRRLEGEPGLEELNVYHGLEQQDEVMLAQQWSSLEPLEGYLRSAEFLRLLEVMDLSQESPELRIDTISQRRGLEFVEGLRQQESAIR